MGVFTRALKNLSRRKTRALLVIVALGFSMAIMISIPSSIIANQAAAESLSTNYRSIIDSMEEEINKTLTLIQCSFTPSFTSTDRPSVPGGGGWGGFMQQQEQFLNKSAFIEDIGSTQGIKDIVPFLEKTVGTNQTIETPRGTFEMLVADYTIVGVPLNSTLLDRYVILPSNVTAGRNLQEGDSGVVLLSEDNAEYFGAGDGDTVNILGYDFTVVGIYQTSDPLALNKLYMEISEAQAISDLGGQVSRIDVYAEDQSYVDEIADTIKTLYPELYLTTYEERLSQLQSTTQTYQTLLESSESNLGQMQSVAFQEVVIAIVATSSIVLFMMLYSVRERTKEIGILKAIGFSNWNIMSQFMIEGILLSLVAAAIGVAIGIIGAPLLSSFLLPSVSLFPTQQGRPGQTINPGMVLSQSVAAAPDLQTMLLMFGLAVSLGALGSLYPAWRAARTSPMEALKNE